MKTITASIEVKRYKKVTFEVTDEQYAEFNRQMDMTDSQYKELRESKGEPSLGCCFYDLEKAYAPLLVGKDEDYIEESFSIDGATY